jgi:hypothetical protein
VASNICGPLSTETLELAVRAKWKFKWVGVSDLGFRNKIWGMNLKTGKSTESVLDIKNFGRTHKGYCPVVDAQSSKYCHV